MRKIAKPIRNQHPPVRLYLEDLKKIVSIFSEHEPGTYEIVHDEYSFDSLNDLLEHVEENVLEKLKFVFSKPEEQSPNINTEISVSFGSKTHIYADPATDQAWSIVGQVEKLLKPKFLSGFDLRKPASGSRILSGTVLIVLIVAASQLFSMFISLPVTLGLILGIGFGTLFFSIFMLIGTAGRNSQIILRQAEEQKSFLARNGDRIIMLILGGMITLATLWIANELGITK